MTTICCPSALLPGCAGQNPGELGVLGPQGDERPVRQIMPETGTGRPGEGRSAMPVEQYLIILFKAGVKPPGLLLPGTENQIVKQRDPRHQPRTREQAHHPVMLAGACIQVAALGRMLHQEGLVATAKLVPRR